MSCTLSKEQIDQTISFHGHWCPGLAIGIRAAEWVLINLGRDQDEEIVSVMETRTRKYQERTLCIPCFESLKT